MQGMSKEPRFDRRKYKQGSKEHLTWRLDLFATRAGARKAPQHQLIAKVSLAALRPFLEPREHASLYYAWDEARSGGGIKTLQEACAKVRARIL